MTFRENLQAYYIPRREYTLRGYRVAIFTTISSEHRCSLKCSGSFGECDGTTLNFENINGACPYDGNDIRAIAVCPLEVTNTRW